MQQCNQCEGAVKTLWKKGRLDKMVHHASITEDDFSIIKAALDPNTPDGPVKILWFDVQLHFGRRGNELLDEGLEARQIMSISRHK